VLNLSIDLKTYESIKEEEHERQIKCTVPAEHKESRKFPSVGSEQRARGVYSSQLDVKEPSQNIVMFNEEEQKRQFRGIFSII
jgi:hypothetical protein